MAILKVIEILSDSTESWEDAAADAVKKASKTIKKIRSAFVQSQSITVVDGEAHKYRVNVKVTFEVE